MPVAVLNPSAQLADLADQQQTQADFEIPHGQTYYYTSDRAGRSCLQGVTIAREETDGVLA
jgi:hypothetical protein